MALDRHRGGPEEGEQGFLQLRKQHPVTKDGVRSDYRVLSVDSGDRSVDPAPCADVLLGAMAPTLDTNRQPPEEALRHLVWVTQPDFAPNRRHQGFRGSLQTARQSPPGVWEGR
jgi:hypothetical protein